MVKAYKSHYHTRNDDVINTRMVSAAQVMGEEHSVFPMPAEEFIEPGLHDSSYNIASLSRRLQSTARITDMPHQLVGGDTNDVPLAKTFVSKDRHPVVSADSITERWFIDIDDAVQTYRETNQKGVGLKILPVSRRYRTDIILTGQEKW